jgi:hypothetical protein
MSAAGPEEDCSRAASQVGKGESEEEGRLMFYFPHFSGTKRPTLGTLDPLKIYAANLARRDHTAALRTHSLDGRQNLFEIDFLLPGHARNCLTARSSRGF